MASTAFLSTRSVAQQLGVSVPTVTRYVRAGTLPVAGKAPGTRGAYLFDPVAVAEFIAGSAL